MMFLPLLSVFNATSIDCPNLINLATAMGMNKAQPKIKTDCCLANGVTCDLSK